MTGDYSNLYINEENNMTTSAWKNSLLSIMERVGVINLLQRTGSNDRNSLYILTYHRVERPAEIPWLSEADINVTPEMFEEQMKFLSARYHPVSIEEVLDAVHGGTPLPGDSVLVTVDDGYRSFYDTIQPVCQTYGISPLLFVSTAFVEKGTFWWDKVYQIVFLSGLNELDTPIGRRSIATLKEKQYVLRELLQALKNVSFSQLTEWVDPIHSELVHLSEEQEHNTVTWDELRELRAKGVAVASHTHTHPLLTRISLEEARREVKVSQELIKRELGTALPVFAFPDGKMRAVNQNLIDMLNSEGFELVFLLQDGRARLHPENRFHTLPRLAMWPDQTLPQFHLRLTPLINWMSS